MPDLVFHIVNFSAEVPPSVEEESGSSESTGSVPTKRKPGRPVGSSNAKKRQIEDDDTQNHCEKHRPGRPRGSGPKQRAKARETALRHSREIPWTPGMPLRRPGAGTQSHLTCSTANIAETSSLPSVASDTPLLDSATEPQAQEDGRSAINRIQDHIRAEMTGDSEPLPTDLPNNGIDIIDDIDNSENLSSFMSEGLGSDEIEDGDDDIKTNRGGGNPKNQRRSHPEWLQKLFSDIIEEISKDRKGIRGRSRHYIAGTFWLPCQAIWFYLNKQDVKPTDVFLPQFFYWDPLDLLEGSGILCPHCGHGLTRFGPVKRPRRVVDIDACFWLIGSLYSCRKSNAGGCGKVFRSWDPRILEKLPRALAAEFPAKLTWRSALSWRAFGILRSCIQHGMGAGEVAEMFRMQHLRRYDEIRLQYLHTKVNHIHLPHQGYEPFLPFDDQSDHGFHGFTPSGQWFRDIYDDVMESHCDTLNQHTAMLTARICAIDHSHKIAKHVFKVNGVPIFTALLTMTNENGEIRVCIFVATKSHSQYTEVLRKVSQDLSLYGHSQPELIYTDNMSDKTMLERIFTSLLDQVVPVQKYSHLPDFSLPPSCVPQVLDSVSAINNAIRGILNDLPMPSELQSGGNLVVGYDSEWNVDMSGLGHVVSRGPPAVVQIAYKDQVFILQIGEMLSRKSLPQELCNFLKDSRVIKAGRLVNGDLNQLAIAAGEDPGTFQGGLDLASFAKQRLLITDARVSLAELTAVILGKCLAKNRTERVSSNWNDQELTTDQIQYAACDAYVSLCLYNKISQSPEPTSISSTSNLADLVGQPVVVLTGDKKKIAARGVISKAVTHPSFDNINITLTRTVVSIQEIMIPATVMTQHRHQPLSSMGSVPFDVVVHRSHIRTFNDTTTALDTFTQSLSASLPDVPPPPLLMQNSIITDEPETSPQDDSEIPVSDLLSTDNIPDGTPPPPPLNESQLEEFQDPDSMKIGSEILGPRAPDSTSFIRSRVLKDVFHVFNMLYISRTHGLRIPFAQALRDSLLIPHPEDKARIEAWLATRDLCWNDVLRLNPTWLWRRCRRTIPPPEILFPLVYDVFMTWGPLKDAKAQLTLFNDAAWKIAKNILELIRNGFISDPPGIPLYYIIGLDANGLPIYRCIRGTNSVEGGVHTHLHAMLPTCGASVRHMVTCLLDFILRHNLLVGTFNTTGKKFAGHDSIWLRNEIQELEITLATAYPSTPVLELSFVNGNLYQQTAETMGIVSVPVSL
ncbi:hypothetical protein C0992_001314 [Termitomyces sp. T32_za158]|nr:hypothetical protein C0992_001314 [Termitomyces sp. T32_za158]